jgi:hypothetical protein
MLSGANTNEGHEIPGHGRTAKRGDGRTAPGISQGLAQAVAGGLGQNGLVGFDHVDGGAGPAQFARDDVARDAGAGQQDALAGHSFAKALHDRLSNVLFRNNLHGQTLPLNCPLGGRPDGSNLQMLQSVGGQAQFFDPLRDGLDAVHAGKDEPVVVLDVDQSLIQRTAGARFADFDERDFEHLRTERLELRREGAGLVPGASDQYSFTCQR